MTTKPVDPVFGAGGTLPAIPVVVPPVRMTSRPPRVTTTTPGVIRKVLPR